MPRHADLLGAEILAEIPLEERELNDDEEFQGLVRAAVEEAIQWREEHLDHDQAQATDYYHAQPFGDEKEGRSQVVDTTVRDTVLQILPSLLRIFFGSEKVVEFKPDHPHQAAEAALKTKYIQYIIAEDNPGFMTFYSVFKDALIRKTGVIKYWWDDTERVEAEEFTGLTAAQVEILSMAGAEGDDEILDIIVSEIVPEVRDVEEDPETGEEVEVVVDPGEFDVTLKRLVRQGRARIAAVPPEEFIWSPGARSIEDANMVGHIRDVPADELIGMGVDEDLVEKHKGRTDDGGRRNALKDAREVDQGSRRGFEDEGEESRRPVRFADLYMYVTDPDTGRAELRRIQAIGDAAEIVSNRPASRKPFALFGPDPEPHTMVGLSVADYVKDLQRINSQIWRGVMDSLAQHLDPAQEVVDGQVNMKDLLSPEPNRIVRVRQPGMIREMSSPFVGGAGLPVLEYLEHVKENRTGQSRAAAGLDADALQSATKMAVAGTLSAAQQRTELIARIFSETGMKDLMLGLLELIIQNQDHARMVEIGGEFIEIDPRHWKATKNVTVHVALGAGMTEDKIRTLTMLKETQEQYIQNGVPFVSFVELRNTLARITELAGMTDATEFWKPWSLEEQMQFDQAQAEAAENEPDEVQALVQVEMAKIQQKQEEAQAKLQQEQMEAQAKMQQEMEKLRAQSQEKMAEREARQQEKAMDLMHKRQQAAADLDLRLRDSALRDERERTRMMLDYRINLAKLGQEEADRALKAELEAAKLGLEAEKEEVKSTREIAAMIRDLAELDMEIEGFNSHPAGGLPRSVEPTEEPAPE